MFGSLLRPHAIASAYPDATLRKTQRLRVIL